MTRWDEFDEELWASRRLAAFHLMRRCGNVVLRALETIFSSRVNLAM